MLRVLAVSYGRGRHHGGRMDILISVIGGLPVGLSSVPVVVWTVLGSIITGLFTLLGIRYTNIGHEKRLRDQFSNDREIKRVDREHTMRRDVYLNATEAMAVGCQMIVNLANQTMLADAATKPYFEKSQAIARALLIATPATGRLLLKFRGKLAEAVPQAMANRMPDHFVGRPDQLRAAMDARRLELGAANLAKAAAISRGDGSGIIEQQAIVDWLHGDIARLFEELVDLKKEIFERQTQGVLEAMANVRELERLATEVGASMRSELQLPADLEEITALVEEAGQAAEVSMKAYIERVKAQAAESGD